MSCAAGSVVYRGGGLVASFLGTAPVTSSFVGSHHLALVVRRESSPGRSHSVRADCARFVRDRKRRRVEGNAADVVLLERLTVLYGLPEMVKTGIHLPPGGCTLHARGRLHGRTSTTTKLPRTAGGPGGVQRNTR